MAKITTTSTNNTALFTTPAHLWIGEPTTIRAHIVSLLQQQFCTQHGCSSCTICNAITQEQYYAIRWVRPDTLYTRDILEPIFQQLSFSLHQEEQFFFILEQVDFMPLACANSLLKSLEEPPHGYYFFLCAQREHTILPTIRSRCIAHAITTNKEHQITHVLFDYFTSATFYDPASFLKDLDQSEITEQESITLLDALLTYWIRTAKEALQKNNIPVYTNATHMIAIISHAFEQPPMPGSSKLFWKNLYLTVKSPMDTHAMAYK